MKAIFLTILLLTTSSILSQEQSSQQPTNTQPILENKLPSLDVKKAAADRQLAYKKEYAFLSSQVKSLKKRLQEFKRTSQSDKDKANKQLSQLENKILSLEKLDNRYQDDIFSIQRNSESAVDNTSLLDATITQAQSTLTEFDFEGFAENSEMADIEKIALLVNKATTVLKQSSQVTKSTGAFFLQNGSEVQGDLLKIGNIATYGSSPQGGGALSPAGEHKFKVWRAEDAEVVKQLISNPTAEMNKARPIFLYESSIKSIEEKKDKTILSVINSGGLISWIIVALGLFALLLIALRIWFLKRSSTSTEKILNKVVYNIENNDMEHAIKVASYKNSSSGRVLYAVLRNITRDREHIEDIVSESILHESAQLNRFGSLIMVVATVTPLLGLLGTVTGMISTFDIITEFGTGDPKLLSSGISLALVTTEVGLAVAIPALLFGNILSGWAERIKDDMEKAALRVINVYKKLNFSS